MSNLCFLDTETSGLNVNKHTILQVSFIITDELLNERLAFTQYIRPYDSEIDEDALKINKLYDYASFTPPSIVAQNLKTVFEKYEPLNLVGWNVSFDWDFLRKFSRETDLGLERYFTYAPLDVRSMAFSEFYNKVRPISLHQGDVGKRLDIEYNGELHNAETDVRLTLEIFKKLHNMK
ncbi:MAG: 3'-5' exonuclease [Candidatus Paceibacterota bacterium]|jgi:DNA polymerase III epsilon subunit-like protein